MRSNRQFFREWFRSWPYFWRETAAASESQWLIKVRDVDLGGQAFRSPFQKPAVLTAADARSAEADPSLQRILCAC